MNGSLLPILDKKKFGFRLKELRTAAGYTQKQCFDLIRNGDTTDAKTFRSWEQGKTLPSLDDLYSICKLFNCSSDYLMGLIDEKDIRYHALQEMTGLSHDSMWNLEQINRATPEISILLNKLLENPCCDWLLKTIDKYCRTDFNIRHNVTTDDNFHFVINGNTLKYQILNTFNIILSQIKANWK